MVEAENTIRARFVAGIEAWNSGDINAYLAGYWPSEKTRWVSGATIIRGSDNIASAYRARFATPETMGTLQLVALEIDLLTSSDALIFGKLIHSLDTNARDVFFTVHMRQIDNDWLIVSDHASTG